MNLFNNNPFVPHFILLLVVVMIFVYRFNDYVIKKNYLVFVDVPCIVDQERCFDPDQGLSVLESPYKNIQISAKNKIICLEEHSCNKFSCDDLTMCQEKYCIHEEQGDGDLCFGEM